jgi:hypothetical protein
MTELVHLATTDGLVTVDRDGRDVRRDFGGARVAAVDSRDGRVSVAIEYRGVYRQSNGSWEHLGLEGATVWAVADDGSGAVLAGLEPAALWRLRDGEARELEGLRAVEGYRDWHSPWGPADLSTIVADGPRLVVGVEVGGVAVSYDGGASWSARNDGLYEDVHHVLADGPDLLATTGMGCHRARGDSGAWEWVNDGIDRGYTLGLARARDGYVVSAASGPPPLWEERGPEAALFRAARPAPEALRWELVCDDFAGSVERQGVAAAGDLVVAATTAGELLRSDDGGRRFARLRADLPPVHAVALRT